MREYIGHQLPGLKQALSGQSGLNSLPWEMYRGILHIDFGLLPVTGDYRLF